MAKRTKTKPLQPSKDENRTPHESEQKRYSLKWTRPTMDDWQKDLLNHAEQNYILLCGRQVGKSEITSYLEALYLLNTPNSHLLIVSGVERQASGLYNKIKRLIEENHPKMFKTGKDKPLNTVFKLKNGSICRTEPLGTDGAGARQHTITRLVIEEMQLVPEEAFAAITPMLLTTGGQIHMLGTAWATEGYAYERLSDPDFYVVRVNAEEVAEQRPEPNRTFMLHYLEKERKRLTETQYMQEYLAIPSEKARQIFTDNLIKKCLVLQRQEPNLQDRHSCGIDPAGLGEDQGAITILNTQDKEFVKQLDLILTEKLYTTQMTEKIVELNKRFDFARIYIDDGGVGFGVFSELLNTDDTRNKTIALNNAQRSLTRDGKRKKRILKEDLYINLLKMMEKGQIKLINSPELRESLKSVKFEYSENGNLIISSTYNHPVESLVRAAWDVQEYKHLNLSIYSIPI